MTRMGQSAQVKGTDAEHRAQAPMTPGVTSCWWRQEGVRELLGVVLALKQPSEQSYIKAGRGSPVLSTAAISLP